jgi:exodeoxyribonuclease VII small subunit
MARKNTPFNFEESLANLESLVEAMEAGDLSLEEALKAFEQGIRLTRECQQALEQAEQ